MKKLIHPTAIVGKGAQLDPSVQVGPYTIISDHVVIGRDTRLHGHVTIDGHTTIGEGCEIFPYASIGLPPQDVKYKGEDTRLVIGDRNVIREYVSIHRGSTGGVGTTGIGSDNFIMAYCHVAHDCHVGHRVVMANCATLAGHVVVQDSANIGGLVAVHQHARIGAYAMIGGVSGVAQDIPPFMIASGERAKLYGPNLVGLKRAGFSDEKIVAVKKAYRIIFKSKLSLKEAIREVQAQIKDSPEVDSLVEFISAASPRGIAR